MDDIGVGFRRKRIKRALFLYAERLVLIALAVGMMCVFWVFIRGLIGLAVA